MPATLAGFGFRPAYHPTGLDRADAYTILTSYATPLYKGTPVVLNTDGTIRVGAVSADILGIFDGVQYTDGNGKPTLSNYWPGAVTNGTNITAFVWTDPQIVYEVQADGSIAQTAVGDQADPTTATIASGSTSTGLSVATLSASLAGAGSQAQWRIVGFGLAPDNAVGDAYTVVRVQLARSQYVSNKVAI
jgi:hypothetical protein